MIIYQIKNNFNEMRYIGQTTRDIKYRWKQHSSPNTSCPYISRAIQKYGKENFTIEIIDRGDSIDDLNRKEEFWIKFLDTMSPNGYNLTSGGENNTHSEETRKKISDRNKGKIVSEETRFKISVANKGKKQSKETIKKRSESNRGLKRKPFSAEACKNISNAAKGRKFSEETKLKISQLGKGRKHTEETKLKISQTKRIKRYLKEKEDGAQWLF